MFRKIIKSRLFLSFGLLLLLYTGYLLARQLLTRYEINQEIRSLEADIRKFESQNKEILELMTYFKTSEYRERQARSLLNLQKPGEFAVALPPEEAEPEQTETPSASPEISNLRAWWDYFFAQ